MPPTIPDHELIQEIGRGSYGLVWLAKSSLGVYRAVKFVYRQSFENQRPFDREWTGIQNFEPISRSHEGFMDILQVGINREAGYFYYVMELGDDAVLGQQIDPQQYQAKTLAGEITAQQRLPYEECLKMGLALSLALAEVHKRGLVHRDVKPSNVIYVNGVPKLADIGLVAEMGDAPSYVGTEGFIPPEGPGSPQADVYGLGKLLYEASTGRDRQDFPELPTQLGAMVQEDRFLELNEVLIRACHRDIKLRYQTAWDMHAHLLVLANGKSVKRLNQLERRVAQAKRATILTAMALTLLAAVGFHFYREWRFHFELQQQLVAEDVAHGDQAVDQGSPLTALPQYADALRLDHNDPEHEFLHRLRFGSVLAQTPKETLFLKESQAVATGSFDESGDKLLITEFQKDAKLYDLRSHEVIFTLSADEHYTTSAALSPDGRFAVTTAKGTDRCFVWDLAKKKIAFSLPHEEGVFFASYSHDGKHIVTCGRTNYARVWNSSTGNLELKLIGHTETISFADYSHKDRMIITGSKDGTARIWDAQTGKAMYKPLPHGGWVNYAAFSPDDEMIVTAGTDRTARLWHLNGDQFPIWITHHQSVSSAVFSPDGRFILTASFDGTVCLWNADNLQPAQSNPVLKLGSQVRQARFNPDGESILAVCEDGSVRIWSLAGSVIPTRKVEGLFCPDGSRYFNVTNQVVEVRETLTGSLLSQIHPSGALKRPLTFSRDGRFVLISTVEENDATNINFALTVWNTSTGKAIAPALLCSNLYENVVLSNDGKKLVLYGGKVAQTWDVEAGKPLAPEMFHQAEISAVDFSPDGQTIASTSDDLVYVWNTSNGELLFPPLKHRYGVTHVEFSPDGSRLISTFAEPTLAHCSAQIWDARTGAPSTKVTLNDGVLYACFSPDGEQFATADEDFCAAVWDARSGQRLTPLLQHNEQVKMVAFSPDGKLLVTTCADNATRVWDVKTGAPLSPKLWHQDGVSKARFLADGRSIVASGTRYHAFIWKLQATDGKVEDVQGIARLVSNGQFAPQEIQKGTGSEPLEKLWQTLKERYPARFTTTTAEIEAWHELEANRNRVDKHWAAEMFHIQRLLLIHPQDEALIKRLKTAESHLDKSKTTN